MNAFKRTPDGLWDVTIARAESFVNVLNFSIYETTFTFERRALYYIMNIVAPCVFISFLVPLIFFLPAGSGEKMSMGVTILLSFTVFQLVIANSIPSTRVSLAQTDHPRMIFEGLDSSTYIVCDSAMRTPVIASHVIDHVI
jgi:hypothetical protein